MELCQETLAWGRQAVFLQITFLMVKMMLVSLHSPAVVPHRDARVQVLPHTPVPMMCDCSGTWREIPAASWDPL